MKNRNKQTRTARRGQNDQTGRLRATGPDRTLQIAVERLVGLCKINQISFISTNFKRPYVITSTAVHRVESSLSLRKCHDDIKANFKNDIYYSRNKLLYLT